MGFEHWLVILSVPLSFVGSAAYIRNTIAGRTKPNRVSWALWAITPLIGTAAAISAGADMWATVRIFLGGFLPLIVFASTFINQQSYWKLTTFDLLCGVCAVFALGLWLIADSPQLAILFAVLGDGFASLPTIWKSWKFPETETGFTFIIAFTSALMIVPSIPVWNIENSAFQIYLLAVNATLVVAVYRKRFFKF